MTSVQKLSEINSSHLYSQQLSHTGCIKEGKQSLNFQILNLAPHMASVSWTHEAEEWQMDQGSLCVSSRRPSALGPLAQ